MKTDYEAPHKALVTKATDELKALFKAGLVWEAAIYAIPTIKGENGTLTATTRLDDKYFKERTPDQWPRVVRPRDCGASTYERWDSVPYTAMWEILYRATRRDPILPIEGNES